MESDLERKRLEGELRLAEARSSGILSISSDAIISVDESQRITMFNDGAEQIFGYSRAEAIGAPLAMLIPERLRAVHDQHVGAFAAGKQPARLMGQRSTTILGLRKNGQEFPADAAISKLEVGGERVLTVALRDITVQKRIEREQKFLAEVGKVLADTLDYEKTLTRIAELAVRDIADLCIVEMVGAGEERGQLEVASRDPSKAWLCELLTKSPLDGRGPRLLGSVLKTRQSVLLQEPTAETLASLAENEEQYRALRAVGIRSLVAVPLVAHARLVGAMAFVSSRRLFEPADVRLAEELALRAALSIENARLYRAAQRATQSRDDVLGVVAHDLRNPLNSILLQATFLQRAREPDRRSRKPADAIARAATRMDRLIQDLLDLTRLDAGRLSVEPARASARQLVADSVEAQSPLASTASLELRVDAARELPEVWADRERVLQVFGNLIGNALKFTKPGGRITVGAAPRQGEVLFWVTDTGAGIAAEELPHLFDRFWQGGTNRRLGAGLGLAIVKGVIEAHHGRVWAESVPGQGSTFFFTLPAVPRAETSQSPGHARILDQLGTATTG